MEYRFRHKLKRILVKAKLWKFFEPLYARLVYFSSQSRKNQGDYAELVNFYSQFIKPGDLCFDIGAYRGIKTEALVELGAKVVALEPQENCFYYLKKKFGKNPNCFLIKKGLSDKEEKLVLSICQEADSISTFSAQWKTGRFSNYKWTKKQLVDCTTLDNLIKEFGLPVFCKIDVEGFELKVLKGLSQPIKFLSFEFVKEFPQQTKECLNYLLSLGYNEFNFVLAESRHFYLSHWCSAKELEERLNLGVNNNLLWGDIYARFL